MQLIDERNPKTIGLNFSKHFNISDGLDKNSSDEHMTTIHEDAGNVDKRLPK